MPVTRLKYWKPTQLAEALKFGKLNHIASDQLGAVNPGDRIWVTSTRPDGRLVTLGSIVVNEVIGHAAARRKLEKYYDPYRAKYHVVVPYDDAESTVEVDLTPIAGRLRFVSPISDRLDMKRGGRLVGQQLQRMRVLSPASAKLFDTHWRSRRAIEEKHLGSQLDELEAADRERRVAVRTEQQALRRLLLGNARSHSCAVCGQDYPASMLIAAHIKPRAQCSSAERKAWRANVVPMCLMGCDAMFERGLVRIRGGKVRVKVPAPSTQALRTRLRQLNGRHSPAWNEATKQFFEWHARRHAAGLV